MQLIFRGKFALLTGILLMLGAMVVSNSLWAGVELPNGFYHTTQDDLVVKVMGGYVKAEHTWFNGYWYFSRGWQPISFSYISGGGVVGGGIDGGLGAATGTSSGGGAVAGGVGGGSIAPPPQETDQDCSTASPPSLTHACVPPSDKIQGTAAALGTPTFTRNNAVYVPAGSDDTRFVYEHHYFITILGGTLDNPSAITGYKWTDSKGDWALYDTNYRLVRYGNRNNVQISFQYDSKGRRTGVFDTFGNQVLWYTYNDTTNHLISVRDQADATQAHVVYYNWTNNELTSVVDVLGNTWTYGYDNIAQVSTITDPDGHVTNIAYNASRLKSVTNGNGNGVFYTFTYDKTAETYYVRQKFSSGKIVDTWYNKDGYLIRQDINGTTVKKVAINGRTYITTNELGFVTTEQTDEWNNVTKITKPDQSTVTYTYDTSNSNLLSKTDQRGVVTKYDYDSHGNLITKTEAVGLPEQRITHYTYDSYGNLLTVERDADANTQEALTTYTYDNFGNVTSKSQRVNTNETDTIYYNMYDRMGNLLQWHDARSNLWQATYDAKGELKSITDPLNHSLSFKYDGAGNMITLTNQLGYQRRYSFDAYNRLVGYQDLEGQNWTIEYYADGLEKDLLDPLHRVVMALQYDAQGRVSKTTDSTGAVTSIQYGVDTQNNVPYDLPAIVSYPTHSVSLTYDELGRVVKYTNDYGSNSSVENIAYNSLGDVTSTTDEELHTYKYQYDNLNRLDGIVNNAGENITVAYDNRNNPISITNEAGVVLRQYQYDEKNRETQELWPNGGGYKFTYDPNNDLTEQTDGKGQITQYIYDAANRATQQLFYQDQTAFTNSQPTKTVNFAYNAAGMITSYNDGTTSATYTFNNNNQLLTEALLYPNNINVSLKYSYAPNSKESSFTGPDGITYNYSYDDTNHLTSVSLPGAGQINLSGYQWQRVGQIAFPGGSKEIFDYNGLSQLTQYQALDPANNVLLDAKLTLDKIGDITAKQTAQGGYTYAYDLLKRLTDISYPSQPEQKYTYDQAGNRVSDNSITEQIQYNNLNQLLTYGPDSFTYDANGSMVSKSVNNVLVRQYVYNLDNRLTDVKDGSGQNIASYYYGPFGMRLWKDVGGVRTYFVYGKQGLVAELDSSGNVTRSYGYLPSSKWGTSPIFTHTSNGYGYYLTNQLSATQMVIDKTGAVLWKGQQQAFGQTKELIGAGSNNLRFPGQYYDAETGLDYNFHRYYDPTTGRYISSDPTDLSGGLNTYVYAGSSPLVNYDNTGRFVVAAGIGAVIGGACSYIKCKLAKGQNCGCKAAFGAAEGAISGMTDGLGGQAANAALDAVKKKVCHNPVNCAPGDENNPGDFADKLKEKMGEKIKDKINDPFYNKQRNLLNRARKTLGYRYLSGRSKRRLVDHYINKAWKEHYIAKIKGGVAGCIEDLVGKWLSKYF